LTAEERELLQKLLEAFDEEGLKKSLGIKKFKSGSRAKQLEEYYMGPTLNISGYQCGYTGPYTKTNLPRSASVKMDIRFVPNQASDEILGKLRAHLDNHGFSEVEIHKQAALSWYRTPPTADIVQVIVRGTKAMGIEPIVYPSGFWSDPCSVVAKAGNLYHRVVMFGAGGSGNYHSANEWVSVEGLRLCEKQFGAFLYQYGKV
jgi:acetylornithine deacetylase/succinyl-diaminopimelate desuccinylase-like protein